MKNYLLVLMFVSIFLILGCSEPPKEIVSPICGNQICEEGESQDYCPYDCAIDCKSNFCNDKVLVYCDQPNCTEQELFPAFLEMQTKVYGCLSAYFKFTPHRIPYLIYPSKSPPCSQKKGCEGSEGGQATSYGIRMYGLSGFHPYEKNHPTKQEHLTADKHETTHYFIFQMLGPSVPLWFHEAIAIQTNERLFCHDREDLNGDAYLNEREEAKDPDYKYGVGMDDKTSLNSNFYQRLKKGQTTLSESEKSTSHILGTLFIIGLKEDYHCEKECVTKILYQLYQRRDINAQMPAEEIKVATNTIVGQDTQPIFDLLGIQ
ncbi:MAG: hypothetical protein V2A62_01465 [Candidatus Woesearchaeota archaeon]